MIYMPSAKGGGMDFCYVTSGGGLRFLLHSVTRGGGGGRRGRNFAKKWIT